MSDLSAADIAEGHRLDKAATDGPWWGTTLKEIYGGDGAIDSGLIGGIWYRADSDLIVWARNHLSALLDAAEKLARIKALHVPNESHDLDTDPDCDECCGAWPCPTIRAINSEETDSGE